MWCSVCPHLSLEEFDTSNSIPANDDGKENKQIFISHSSRDKKFRVWLTRLFAGINTQNSRAGINTRVKPVFMEYEEWKRTEANWQWIKSEIEKSEALVLVLTRNIVNKEHTQNWVAYEIGVAATINKDVVVLRDRGGKAVNFPVPYFNEYYLVPIIQRGKWKAVNANIIMNDIIHGKRRDPNVTCPYCSLEYFYSPAIRNFECPCCGHVLSFPEEP
jgi:hypothetical protein